MAFRSRANPDQRRRRVLLEETCHDEPRPVVAAPSGKRNKRYPDDALTDAQPRITDLLPRSSKSLALSIASLALLDVGLVALHWFAPDWQTQLPDVPLGIFDATNPYGLAQLTLLGQLLLVQAGCCLIYAVRRRRLDDLRGTYQVWIWAAIIAGLGALLAATELSDLIAYGVSCIPHFPDLSHPRFYYWAVLAAILLPLNIRLLIEVRRTRPAQILLTAATVVFVAREVLTMQWLQIPDRIASTALAVTALCSATLLLAALLFQGRYVKLDAMGAFSKKKGKKRKKKEAESEEAGDKEPTVKSRHRVDTGSSEVPRPNSIGAAIGSSRSKDQDEEEDRHAGPLSKANRKSMRR